MHSSGAASGVVRVHHHHVLISTKLGQALSVAVRIHTVILIPIWSLSPDSMLLVPDVACIQHAHSGHLQPPRSIGTVRRVPFCQPNRTTCLSPSRQEVEDRAQSTGGPTSTFLPLWLLLFPVRQLVERPLPDFADVQFDCNNETCMSICPSSHPVAPLEKSVSSQHTVSHQRAMSTWSLGTGQENHVVCLKSEQDLFQSASLPRTRSKRTVGADQEHACCEAPLACAREKHQNTIPRTREAFASKTSEQHFEKKRLKSQEDEHEGLTKRRINSKSQGCQKMCTSEVLRMRRSLAH